MSRIDVLGVGFDNLTMEEAVNAALRFTERREAAYAATPNPEIVMMARSDGALSRALAGANLVLADGIGVIKGAQILGTPLKGRVPGIDFACALMGHLAERGGSVYLFGARPGVAERAGAELARRYPGLRIAGASDGYFTDDGPIVERINASSPDLLMVCLGSPKQELWMEAHAHALSVGLMAGLGGSLDVLSGEVKRAPERWQRLGLEWLYRLLKEPRRIGRMMKLPQFVVEAARQRARGRRDGKQG